MNSFILKLGWVYLGWDTNLVGSITCMVDMVSGYPRFFIHSPSANTNMPCTQNNVETLFAIDHLRSHNRHYSVKSVTSSSPDLVSSDHTTYLEERYGRNLPLSAASSAKRALRRRIARTLLHDDDQPDAGVDGPDLTGPSSRGVKSVTEDDVYLYPWYLECT